jgi:myxalamid-type polyketide synthase MxaE and MxaD
MQALPLPEQGKRQLQLSVTGTIFKIFSRPDNSGAPWSLHCQGQILLDVSKSPEFNQTLHEIQENCPEQPDATEHYQGMRERGLEYGSSFQSVKNIYRGDDTALVKLVLPPDLEKDFTRYLLHPVLLDGAFQAVSQAQRGDNERYLPVGFEVLEIFAPFEDILWCYVKLQPREASEFVAADLLIFNTQEKIVARVEGLRLKRVKKPAVRPEQLANLFYEMEWEQLPEIDKAANPEGAWLVFENDAGTGEQLSAMLEKSGVQIMRVRKGESYSHHGEIFIINPGNPEHLKKLWESFSPDNCPDGILYLCDRELNGVENLRSVLYLTQVLTSLNWPKMPRLWLVTSGAFEFQTPVSENSLTQRDLWAFGGVLVNEYPRLRCTRIDLSDKPDEHELTGLLKEIAANRADNQLAIRADSSFALRFKRSQMPMELAEESLLNPDTSPVVRPDATYLITGGLGGLGLLLAQRLVELGTRYLALVSRREPDSQVMNTLAELEKQGAIVKIYRYDVSRDEQVLELLKQIEEELPPLRGIVHAAATLEDSLLSDMTLEKVQKVFAAKAQGSWWLHKHSQNLPLDFFVLFSSAAAILGNPGQSNYAAANGFLDGLAQYRRTLGLPATSLNWGPWSGAGMAAQIENNSRFEQGGIYSLTPQQGLAAFELVLRRAPAQLAIFAADWETLSQSNGLFLESGLASKLVDRRKQLAAVEVLETLRSNLSKVGENDRVSLIETYLSQVIMRTLGIGVERLDLKLSLYGIGLDSLTAVEIKNRVETDLQLVVPLENLLQGPSISQLSEELAQQLAKL